MQYILYIRLQQRINQMLASTRKYDMDAQNKQNHSSVITCDTLNYKMMRGQQALQLLQHPHNNGNTMIDPRIKSLQNQNSQLQQIYEQSLATHKIQMTALLKRTTKLQERIIQLENNKIENQEQIQCMKKKLQHIVAVDGKHGEQQKEQYQAVREKLQKYIKMHQNVANQNNRLKQEIKIQKQKSIKSSYEVEQLQTQFQRLKQEHREVKLKKEEKISTLMEQIGNVKDALEKQTAELETLKLKYTKIGSQNQKLRKQIISVNQQKHKQKQKTTSNTTTISLQSQLSLKTQQLQLSKSQLTKRQQQIQQLQANIQKWQTQCRKISESRDLMEAEIGKYKMDAIKNKDKYQDIQRIKKQYQDKLEIIGKQYQEKNIRGKKQSQEKCQKIRKQCQDKIKLNIKIQSDSLQQRIAQLTKQCESSHQIILQLQSQLTSQQQKHEQTIQQLQQNRNQYHQALTIEVQRSSELQGLIEKLKQKLNLQVSANGQKERKIQKLQQEIIILQEQIVKIKRQTMEMKEGAGGRDRQWERKLKIIQDQKIYAQLETEKWKALRTESLNQCQQQKREIRRLKGSLQESNERQAILNHKIQSLAYIEQKYSQLQLEKTALTQSHTIQLSSMQKSYELKLKELKQQYELYEQKIKTKIESEMHMQHREQIVRIRRKSEDNGYIVSKYQRKIDQLEKQIEGILIDSKQEVEKCRRQVQRKDKQNAIIIEKNQEIKKKVNIYRQQLQDLTKKYREKETKIQQLYSKLKKSQSMTMRYEFELDQINNQLREIEKQKWVQDEKKKIFEKTISKLEVQLQNKQSTDHKRDFELQQCKQKCQKLNNEIKLSKQKANMMEQNRNQFYHRISEVSSEHFSIQVKSNQLQFLSTLTQKLKSLVQIARKLSETKTTLFKDLKQQSDQFSKTFHKNFDQTAKDNANIKQDYNTLYKKYLKYKQAYIHCKTKMERWRVEAGNDRRFTEEILLHCKTIINKIQ